MKKYLRKIEWFLDYYFVYFLYNGNKLSKYQEYMENKWGKNDR